MSDQPRLLVIEDEKAIRAFLQAGLVGHGFRLEEATTGETGLSLTASLQPEVVLLDLGLPDLDGLTVIERIRSWSKVPIIVLSARDQEGDKIKALEMGADDYLTKPFGMGELLARIRVALRHRDQSQTQSLPPVFQSHHLTVNFASHLVEVAGQVVHLTPIEFKLLSVLIHHQGKLLTHGFLLEAVWGLHNLDQSHYVRIYMANLRKKLELDPANPRFIQTEIGIGYRFLSDEISG